jgi:hypothetical protein
LSKLFHIIPLGGAIFEKENFFTLIIVLFINIIVWAVNERNVIGEVMEIKKAIIFM